MTIAVTTRREPQIAICSISRRYPSRLLFDTAVEDGLG